ncbi:hypothetical protein B0H14DRAFT_2584400 [Mycena olivaceomarginata]|nr:hypothetical protein B0H14DRAFT_2584400 [Mycena olivaceomarginata]
MTGHTFQGSDTAGCLQNMTLSVFLRSIPVTFVPLRGFSKFVYFFILIPVLNFYAAQIMFLIPDLLFHFIKNFHDRRRPRTLGSRDLGRSPTGYSVTPLPTKELNCGFEKI